MNKKISFGITVCNELKEIKHLLSDLLNDEKMPHDDIEIVVQFDQDNGSHEVWSYLKQLESDSKIPFKLISFPLNNDFASFKNNLKEKCSGEYILQIDADEILGRNFKYKIIEFIDTFKEAGIELVLVPRINIVNGITPDYINEMRWRYETYSFPVLEEYNEKAVNFPDPQPRIIKNDPRIHWEGRVHEKVTGHKTYANMATSYSKMLPEEFQKLCLIHIKDFERQKNQNNFYKTIDR